METKLTEQELTLITQYVLGRFGNEIFRNLKEMQIGIGDEVFRADRSGIWLGGATFDEATFSVDMLGNVVANSFATARDGDRIVIKTTNKNEIKFYNAGDLFGYLSFEKTTINKGQIRLLSEDDGAGFIVDVGIGASPFSKARVFSNGGGFATEGSSSSGFNNIFGKNAGFFGVHSIGGVDYVITGILPVGDPSISGALYVDGSGFVKQSP